MVVRNKSRTVLDKETKLKIVYEYLNTKISVKDISKKYDIVPKTFYCMKKQFQLEAQENNKLKEILKPNYNVTKKKVNKDSQGDLIETKSVKKIKQLPQPKPSMKVNMDAFIDELMKNRDSQGNLIETKPVQKMKPLPQPKSSIQLESFNKNKKKVVSIEDKFPELMRLIQ